MKQTLALWILLAAMAGCGPTGPTAEERYATALAILENERRELEFTKAEREKLAALVDQFNQAIVGEKKDTPDNVKQLAEFRSEVKEMDALIEAQTARVSRAMDRVRATEPK